MMIVLLLNQAWISLSLLLITPMALGQQMSNKWVWAWDLYGGEIHIFFFCWIVEQYLLPLFENILEALPEPNQM